MKRAGRPEFPWSVVIASAPDGVQGPAVVL